MSGIAVAFNPSSPLRNPRVRPLAVAVLAALAQVSAGPARSAEATLPEVRVRSTAEERADGPVEGYRAQRSSTFTKTDTPLNEIPASITVVPEQLMKDQAMNSMGQVFRYVPGVQMHQGENNRDDVVIRGNRTNADFYVNGIRDDAQVFRDLYNLERVEVLKGPDGMIFGRGNAGGLVNRVTKRPTFDTIREVNVTYGSFDQYRATFDLGGRLSDTVAWRLNAMGETSNSFRDGVDLNRYAVNPSFTFLLSSRTSLTVDYAHVHDIRHQDRGIPSQNGVPFNTPRSQFFGNAEQSTTHNDYDAFSAVLDHDFANGWQVRNSFRVTRYDRFYQNVYPGSAVSAAGTLTLSAYNNANERTNVFNQTDVTKKFKTGGVEHTVLAGVELGYQDSDNRRLDGVFGAATFLNLPGVPAALPFATVSRFAPNPNGSNAQNNVKADIAGVYVQDQIALSKEWKVIAGLRYDYFRTRFDDQRRVVPPTDLERTDREWSPRAAVVWQPNARSSYYVSYSYAFLPSGEQLGLATTTADLAPEKAINYEIGARWELAPKLTLSSAVFRLDRDDVRVADPANPGFFVKTGQQRTEGLEIGIAGEVMRNWEVFGGYAYLDSRVEKAFSSGTAATPASVIPAGNKVGLTPESSFSLWNKITLGGGWATGLGLIYQDKYFTSFNNTVSVPSFTRVDGAVFYTFSGGKTRLALNVENIFDKKYYPTVDGDNNISPGAPRNARLTLSTKF